MKLFLNALLFLICITGYSQSLQLEIVDNCSSGYVVINNDESPVGYTMIHNGVDILCILPTTTDTIFDLPSGEYILRSNGEAREQVSFTISNTVIDATLHIPYTSVCIGDSYITPILNIYSSYNDVYWDFGDGNILYSDINPVHYYTQPGIYTLKAIVNEGQCSKIFESKIVVENINGIQATNRLQYRTTSNYYNVEGKVVKKL